MNHPVLPRLKRDRIPNTYYQTTHYLRYWDGQDLCCEHKITTKRKCSQCLTSTSAPTVVLTGTEPPTVPCAITVPSSRHIIPGVKGAKIGKNYEVIRRLGAGSFGEIYLGRDLRSQELVALKVEQTRARYPQLLAEFAIYSTLAPALGIPKVYWSGSNSNVNIMVMELLGTNLQEFKQAQGGKLPLAWVNDAARQLLTVLEHFHDQGFLHRDLKLENLMLGQEPSSTIYLVDFGLARRWRDADGRHIPYREGKALLGTPRYCSLCTHAGIEQSRRDDIESLGYVLISLVNGRLPWQGLKAATKQQKHDLIFQQKQEITLPDLCAGLPSAYQTLLQVAHSLDFTERPPYAVLRELFS